MATDRDPAVSVTSGLTPEEQGRGYVRMGYLFAITGALLFSTKAIIIKLVYEHDVDAETLLALRMGFALPFYIVIGLHALRDRRRRDAPLPSRRLVVRAALVGALG
jgi:drug/metabolite transporter (DMT)-like permease